MYTLALETSCDETSVAVIEDGRRILSNIISTQVPIHRKFGGVVPEIASRQHIEYVMPVIKEALEEAEITLNDVDHIGVTYGPGLVGALLVGVATAKGLSFAAAKQFITLGRGQSYGRAYICQLSQSYRIGTALFGPCRVGRPYSACKGAGL